MKMLTRKQLQEVFHLSQAGCASEYCEKCAFVEVQSCHRNWFVINNVVPSKKEQWQLVRRQIVKQLMQGEKHDA